MDILEYQNSLIENNFKILSKESGSIQLSQPQIKNNLVEIASYLWMTEKCQLPLNTNMRDTYVDYVVDQWRNPHAGIFNEKPDIYTSTIALVYASLELIKNNHGKRELQQCLTHIKDFTFDHLLNEGKLISSVSNSYVTPDELFTVWPFNLFSAEDLVIVQAADEIKQNYQQLDVFWQQLYIHYLLSRSYSDEAQSLFDALPKSSSGIYNLLEKRILENETLANSDIIFQHSAFGNNNRYSQLEIQRTPSNPIIGEEITIPLRILSAFKIKKVTLVLLSNRELAKYEMTRSEDIFTAQLSIRQIGNYQYRFEAYTEQGVFKSELYPLVISEWIKIANLSLIQTNSSNMSLSMQDNLGNDYGNIDVEASKKGMKFKLHPNVTSDSANRNSKAELASSDLRIEYENNNLKIKCHDDKNLFVHTNDHPAISLLVTPNKEVKKIYIRLGSDKNEKFYGFGERYNSLNQAGQLVDNYVFNQYRDQGIKTYMPMPLYLSSAGYGLLVATKMYSQFDMTKSPQGKDIIITIELNSKDEGYIYLVSGSAKNILSKISQNTGNPTMLPTWAMGLWMSSNNWDRQSIVNEQLALAKKEKIPATVFVLEQWSDEATYYMFNDSEYNNYHSSDSIDSNKIHFPSWGRWPNPQKMIRNIHRNGLKLILWQIPILKEFPQNRNSMLDADKEYAISHDYVVKNQDNTPYYIPEGWFTNALVWDPTSEQACKWWFSKRQYLLDMGVDGFKTDGGECIFGNKLKFSDGSNGSEMRNQYPILYIGAYYNFLKQNRGITFSRAGYLGAQTMPAHWAGDERSTFEAFQRSLKAGLNAGMSGLIFWGWDFAGFNGKIPTAELYLRATEMATFIPIMQYHAESKAQYNQDRTPWNIQERTGDKTVIPIFRKYANLRMNLLPYIFDESQKAVNSHLPLMKALYLEYQDDPKVSDCFDEFLFGEKLLVAPIIKEGADKRDVYLPNGSWCDFFTNKILSGNGTVHTVNAHIDQIPVFIRENNAILLNTREQEIMSDIGNDLTKYNQPLVKIFVTSNFEQTIKDHLGNLTIVNTNETADGTIYIEIETTINNLKLEVISPNKTKQIIRYHRESQLEKGK